MLLRQRSQTELAEHVIEDELRSWEITVLRLPAFWRNPNQSEKQVRAPRPR